MINLHIISNVVLVLLLSLLIQCNWFIVNQLFKPLQSLFYPFAAASEKKVLLNGILSYNNSTAGSL